MLNLLVPKTDVGGTTCQIPKCYHAMAISRNTNNDSWQRSASSVQKVAAASPNRYPTRAPLPSYLMLPHIHILRMRMIGDDSGDPSHCCSAKPYAIYECLAHIWSRTISALSALQFRYTMVGEWCG